MEELIDYMDFVSVPTNNADTALQRERSLMSKVVVMDRQTIGKLQAQPADVAVVGINETRNSDLLSHTDAPLAIRRNLYALAKINGLPGKIIDLGNIKTTTNPNDSYAALETVIQKLQAQGITTIVLGGSKDLNYPLIKALHNTHNQLKLSLIDAQISMSQNPNAPLAHTYLNKVMAQNLLFDLNVLGYQTYMVDTENIAELQRRDFNLMRLGLVRNKPHEVEAVFRNSNAASFDLGAVRWADCCGVAQPTPNGLYAEEICQLAHFAGTSDQVNTLALTGLIPENDQKNQSATLAAQTIWHFLMGIAHRKHETPDENSSNFKKFVVDMGANTPDMVFYQSQLTGRWWVEVSKDNNAPVYMLPCSASDYQNACKQDFPNNWYRVYYRLRNK